MCESFDRIKEEVEMDADEEREYLENIPEDHCGSARYGKDRIILQIYNNISAY